jgi:predicted RNA-binding protein (virulence factor B family)|tara:strand:+ start:1439 stop:1855 length:417 start_codon:yes stop_codon:yes gene_type:complete
MELDVGEKVGLKIERKTDLGFSVLINNSFEGLLYENEIFEPIEVNMEVLGYIKKIRDDGKYDVLLQPQGFLNVIESNCISILKKLETTGELNLSDRSNPDDIMRQLKLSKKAFKRAIGVLYKEKKILIEKNRILLLTK